MKILTGILSLPFFLTSIYGQSTFSIKRELPPISLTYTELNKIIKDALYLIDEYDSSSKEARIAIDIKNENENQMFDNVKSLELAEFDRAFEFSFQFSNSPGAINRLKIDLNDRDRTIYLEGVNYLLLQTIINQIDKDFKAKGKLLSGPFFRIFCGVLILIFGMSIIWYMEYSIKKDYENISATEAFIKLGLGFLIVIITFLSMLGLGFSFEKVFPGFVVLMDNASFFQRNADTISIIGLATGFLGLPFIQGLFRKRRR